MVITLVSVEILHLRYFVAVAEELNFTRAAARLHMATSPLSRRIRDLERELGAALFIRAHHRVTLTESGEALLPVARDVVERFDAVPAAVTAAESPASRVARVGVAPDVSPALRRAFLDAVGRAAPDIVVRLKPASSGPLLKALRAGEVDIAFVHGRTTEPGVRTLRLDSQPSGVALPAGIGFDGRESVRLGELTELPYVSIRYDAAPGVYRPTDELLSRHGVDKRNTVDGHNLNDLAHMVAGGHGFTFVGLEFGATHKAFIGEPVVILPVDGVEVRLSTDAAWCADRELAGDIVGDLVRIVVTELSRPADGR
ncbi:LysR family transcriptional regulator [Tamaricihabitans halophyticus]|uniref:LysR family transcriptional regulator n=1 Tax=Tamaricihabitans halophyticus TaxID=1262583 RepID=UPI0024374040|nr:LysR family transcriptional regulator [Tamaricihabitans halophyticus]